MCNPNAVNIILTFAIGGITLRIVMELIKNWLKLEGLGAVLMSILLCAIASAIYLVVSSSWSWLCLIFYTAEVFAGTQVAYRATH